MHYLPVPYSPHEFKFGNGWEGVPVSLLTLKKDKFKFEFEFEYGNGLEGVPVSLLTLKRDKFEFELELGKKKERLVSFFT